ADHRDVVVLALELERRRTSCDPQATDLGEHVEELLCETIGEVFLVFFGAHIGERQHRDRQRLLGTRSPRWPRLRPCGVDTKTKYANRAVDILDVLFAEISEFD